MHVEKGTVPYDFNADYMKKVTKKDFIAAHKHLEDLVDLDAEWEKHNGKKDAPASAKPLVP